MRKGHAAKDQQTRGVTSRLCIYMSSIQPISLDMLSSTTWRCRARCRQTPGSVGPEMVVMTFALFFLGLRPLPNGTVISLPPSTTSTPWFSPSVSPSDRSVLSTIIFIAFILAHIVSIISLPLCVQALPPPALPPPLPSRSR